VTDDDAAGPVRRQRDDRQGQAGEAEAPAQHASAGHAAPGGAVAAGLGEIVGKIGVIGVIGVEISIIVGKNAEPAEKNGFLVGGASGDERGRGAGVRPALA